ncbi:fungal-specific transcription factor domain-containing protein [Lentinula aciculospora]|uniref:Fungal-specific transcription factor domain-containing protein n=1 Tax=Lentinula aciculospora TaxID=153920 RepID=A0A9W9A198_9AGAR|nr:fungal-specific transcription factor domain-containing protein [Lentinula aciculospora]
MPEDTPSSSSSSMANNSRPKAPKSSQTSGVVRGRTSPAPGSGVDSSSADARPQKRARKAINCEPCRNSKLKCDRNRPCSSCVLRGTSAMCYQDGKGPDGDSYVRGDDHHYARIDPAAEIARVRHSITMLESYVFPHQRAAASLAPASTHRRNETIIPKKEPVDSDVNDKSSQSGATTAPGMLGSRVQGGLYAGPTSAALHLLSNEGRGSEDGTSSRQPSQERLSNPAPDIADDPSSNDFPALTPEYDRDLLTLLPTVEVIDGLIAYYFEYCNWIYRHVNQPSFSHNWQRFKNGVNSDRIILALACAIMAIATHYLPAQHSLLESLSETHEQLGQKYFDVSTQALHRKQQETKSYTLDLVELLLIRTHYLNMLKNDSEEIWHIRGELVTIGTAMGLHRDPGKWRMHRDVAERRRWAWWHIILLERWQAFMFGRPHAIASHHFDTSLPSFCDPAVDKSGRLYLPNIALFRLAFILGDIMDDAVSVRPVPYESVQANDRALKQWIDNLPSELNLDEYKVARNLASPNANLRRLGVQSVIIRTSYYHIRFTLHRPYASISISQPAPSSSTSIKSTSDSKHSQSLEIAVGAASELITMVGQSRPDFLANSSLAVPGHMNWGPFHVFSAAMFFSFQLIANPDQPGASLFRASIKKAMHTLETCRGIAVADKAYEILFALAPLYSVDFHLQNKEQREKERARILSVVRNLAFPYHDSHDPRRFVDSSPASTGSGRYLANGSPMGSSSVSPPSTVVPGPRTHSDLQGQESNMHSHAGYESSLHTHAAMSSMRTSSMYTHSGGTSNNQIQQNGVGGQHPSSPHSQPQMSPTVANTHAQSMSSMPSSGSPNSFQPYITGPQPQIYSDSSRYVHYPHPGDDASMWGAAVGFGQGEWSQFLDGFRPPPSSSSSVVAHQRHLQG